MNVQIGSDWHLEFHKDRGASFLAELDPTGIDVLIIAGDLLVARFLNDVLQVMSVLSAKYPHILYVPGNHEFFDSDPVQTWGLFEAVQQKLSNVHILRNESITIGDQRFVGSTMWYPPGYPPHIEHLMCDFECIQKFKPWVFKEHEKYKALVETLTPGDVMVTHHLPSMRSVTPFFKKSVINPFFVVPQDELIKAKKPKLWIHGHTHSSFDYMLGDTWVLCNPLGYPHERNRKYNPKLVAACIT